MKNHEFADAINKIDKALQTEEIRIYSVQNIGTPDDLKNVLTDGIPMQLTVIIPLPEEDQEHS